MKINKKQYMREYNQRPKVQARRRKYKRRPEVKAKMKKYMKKYMREYKKRTIKTEEDQIRGDSPDFLEFPRMCRHNLFALHHARFEGDITVLKCAGCKQSYKLGVFGLESL